MIAYLDDVVVVSTSVENFDQAASQKTVEELRLVLAKGYKKIVLDMEGMRFINSTALGRIWGFANLCAPENGPRKAIFIMCNAGTVVSSIIRATTYIGAAREMTATLDAALKKIRESDEVQDQGMHKPGMQISWVVTKGPEQ